MSTHGIRMAVLGLVALLGFGVAGMTGCQNGDQPRRYAADPYGGRPMDAAGRPISVADSAPRFQPPGTQQTSSGVWDPSQTNYRQPDYGQPAYSSGLAPPVVRQQSPPDGYSSSRSRGTVLPPAAANDAEDDEDSGLQFSDISPMKLYANAKAAAGYGPDEAKARAAYAEGERLYADKQYEEAVESFETAAWRWPNSTLQEDALFMQGQSYFFADLYPDAVETFEILVDKYDYTKHLDTAAKRMFQIAQYWDELAEKQNTGLPLGINVTDSSRPKMQTFTNAINAYRFIQMHDPTGPLADDSVMASANAYFRKNHFAMAVQQYDVLREQYSDSEHLIKAQLLAAKCREAMYQGPSYDSTLLDEASEIARQTLVQFPGQLGDERERLLEDRARLAAAKAERDWTIAQYYENRKCYRAAAFYYQAIIDEYPSTRLAANARERIEATQHLPPEPPDRFQWLTHVFGPSD